MPLAVAGAFHTRFMAPAEKALGEHAASVTPADPVTTFLSNADGAAVSDGADVLRRLVAQVTRPVRWDACQATLRELGVTALIELPPAGTLVGLARRELKGVRTLALKTPDDLEPPRNWWPPTFRTGQGRARLRREHPMSPRLQLTAERAPVPDCSGWAASSRNGSSPTTSSPPASRPTTSGSAPGSASRAGASRTRTRTLVDMAADAGARALKDSGLEPSDIGTVIVATCTMLDNIPNAAAQVAHRLGIPAPAAFDINTACSGFAYGHRRRGGPRPGRAPSATSW